MDMLSSLFGFVLAMCLTPGVGGDQGKFTVSCWTVLWNAWAVKKRVRMYPTLPFMGDLNSESALNYGGKKPETVLETVSLFFSALGKTRLVLKARSPSVSSQEFQHIGREWHQIYII